MADCAVDEDATEEMRFLTLLSRPLDSDEAAELLCCGSEGPPSENKLESRRLAFFLSLMLGGLVQRWDDTRRERVDGYAGCRWSSYSMLLKAQHAGYRAMRNNRQEI